MCESMGHLIPVLGQKAAIQMVMNTMVMMFPKTIRRADVHLDLQLRGGTQGLDVVRGAADLHRSVAGQGQRRSSGRAHGHLDLNSPATRRWMNNNTEPSTPYTPDLNTYISFDLGCSRIVVHGATTGIIPQSPNRTDLLHIFPLQRP
ncbi:uncharacterized protein N7503_006350 [Penicillium pulvis]|uniref:uncharacterized protein n=1 Tax=Penicillium pulvis TaxID=1562058 RepID=UPI0025496E78|nr:uncharacterized protein N7503_006350 [Penicillium pulvis]KAJ5798845.1 hypothetical protein N7503_006350 [Penicillium pulvis]